MIETIPYYEPPHHLPDGRFQFLIISAALAPVALGDVPVSPVDGTGNCASELSSVQRRRAVTLTPIGTVDGPLQGNGFGALSTSTSLGFCLGADSSPPLPPSMVDFPRKPAEAIF